MEIITYETDRLLLRERTKDLLETVAKSYSKAEQLAFFGYQTEVELERELINIKKGFTNWKIEFKFWDLILKETEKTIGACGFHSWYQKHHRAELGYGLRQEAFKGKGYMAEAMTFIVDFGFKEMNLNRMEAFISPENLPSRKLIERFGFQIEGTMREHYKNPKTNKLDDSIVYTLLRRAYFGSR